MRKLLSLFALLLLGGCSIEAWEQPPTGIYPPRVGYLNGPPIYFIGLKQTLPVERIGK